ncbi:FAD synthase isoform X2 [Temnothorax americanus]|uniref:FAD synthase isoform X2 n=1 Tax=Temnothorax americanus TaxID=1964332 RepID=UPI004068F41D
MSSSESGKKKSAPYVRPGRPRKKRFQGNQIVNKNYEKLDDNPGPFTASKRKFLNRVDDIAKEISNASKQYSAVFTSGGVGPTHDDVTYEAVAKAFELKLELHQELFDIYTRLIPGQHEIKRLAIVPNSCKIINIDSTEAFPVINVKNVYVLPGSPKYFKPAANTIISRLKGCTPLQFEYIDIELNELSIVDILDKQAKRWDGKVKIGSYPQLELEIPFTRINLEGSEETVAKAKEELLYYLPIQKVINLKHKFSCFQRNIVLENSKNEAHIKCALDILNECYERYNPNEVFISFNGGKDCTVVLHLAATIAKLRNISSLLCLYIIEDSFPESGKRWVESKDPVKTKLKAPETLASRNHSDETITTLSIRGISKGRPVAHQEKAVAVRAEKSRTHTRGWSW